MASLSIYLMDLSILILVLATASSTGSLSVLGVRVDYTQPFKNVVPSFNYNSTEMVRKINETWVSKKPDVPISPDIDRIKNTKNSRVKKSVLDLSLNIPSVLETFSTEKEDNNWYSDSALNRLQEKFDNILLSPNQWDDMTSKTTFEQRKNIPKLFIDFSYPQVSIDLFGWFNEGTKIIKYDTENINLKWVSVPVPLNTTILEHLPYDFQDFFLRSMKLTSTKVGCSIHIWHNQHLPEIELSSVAMTCRHLGAKFFQISVPLDLEEAHRNGFSHAYYMHAIQKLLNDVKLARETIHKYSLHKLTVYIRVITKESPKMKENYPVTVFCNSDVLKANQYFEAMLNWARENDFRIILKSAFDSAFQPHVSSWMSMLRPTESVSQISNFRAQLATIQPSFVMRNYPSAISSGWEIDPCINWANKEESKKPYLAPNFFKTNVTGAVLTFPFKESNPIAVEELQTMLQFMLHKFAVLEFVSNDVNDLIVFLDAISPTFVRKIVKSSLTNRGILFIHCKISEEIKMLGNIAQVQQKLREFQQNTVLLGGGVHLDFSGLSPLAMRPDLIPMLSNIITSMSGLKVGLVLQRNCMDEFRNLTTTSDLDKDILSVNYIVCKEWLDLGRRNEDNMKSLGSRFDGHLYVKRWIQKWYPGLDIYFKLEIDVDFENPLNQRENMDRYLRLLYHCQQFGEKYDIRYFLVEAFNKESSLGIRQNGWWSIQNYTDLTDVNIYSENAAQFHNETIWRPKERLEIRRQHGNTGAGLSTVSIVVFSGIGFIFLFLLGVSFFLTFRYKRMNQMLMTAKEAEKFRNGEEESKNLVDYEGGIGNFKFSTDFQLSLSDINIDFQGKILGAGQFGIVYKGSVKGQQAAIKSPKKDCTKDTFKNELGEVKVLCHLGSHPHIVGFLGAYVNEIQWGKLYIATELCENGSLESYLRSKKSGLTILPGAGYVDFGAVPSEEMVSQEICQFSLEIAKGMEYIASKNVVHGDLATRNVLLDISMTCKISDFGLSRKMYEYKKYVKTSQEPLPWKWMAYESLAEMEFTSMSDVWSYGVTVWEIYSLGITPFGGLNYRPEFIDDLRNGMRLPSPRLATAEIYEKLNECWKLNVHERPTFTEMVDFFTGMRTKEYTDLVPL